MFSINKKGFSLVELIVTIAIMVVMLAVLVPSMISYLERSRASKDIKTMDDAVRVIQMALSDQDVYDEILTHSCFDNISCYIDQESETTCQDKKELVKIAIDGVSEQYKFNEDSRRLDELPYYGAGNMRGITITFSHGTGKDEEYYVIEDAVINKHIGRKTGYLSENPFIYNKLRQAMGDKILIDSQTYRNSDYTVFIRMGTLGGNDETKSDPIFSYGMFGGTNITSDDRGKHLLAKDRIVGSHGSSDFETNEANNSENHDYSETNK